MQALSLPARRTLGVIAYYLYLLDHPMFQPDNHDGWEELEADWASATPEDHKSAHGVLQKVYSVDPSYLQWH
jgi:uncharacterized protein (DUF1800 family)